MQLTKLQARRFILSYQNLLPPRQLEGKNDIYEYIKRVGCIQFDPLDKVGHNPHLILQSRVKNYKPHLLQDLLYKERKLVDGWDKNMSIYTVEDWPYFARHRERAYKQHKDQSELLNKVIPEVRKALKKEGELSSIDLDFDTMVDWSWAPTRAARAALESMYSWGELIIHHKVGTRKVYDFADKYIPSEILEASDPNQSQEEYYQWYVKRRIGAIGLLWSLSGGAWLGVEGLKKKERTQALAQLTNQGEVRKVSVENIKHPFYIWKEALDLLEEVLNSNDFEKKVSFIAPLDNLLWDRKLVKRIFDFEYVWEVYKPVAERKYGYYVLPVLFGDRFIGRMEPVFKKEEKELVIKNWWWEEKVEKTPKLKKALKESLKQFLNYLEGNTINIKADEPILRNMF